MTKTLNNAAKAGALGLALLISAASVGVAQAATADPHQPAVTFSGDGDASDPSRNRFYSGDGEASDPTRKRGINFGPGSTAPKAVPSTPRVVVIKPNDGRTTPFSPRLRRR